MNQTQPTQETGQRTTRPTVHEDGLGGSITILAEGDHERPMIYRMRMPPGVSPPATEMHPGQREEFRVISGTLSLGTIDGKEKLLQAGETYTLEPGHFHLPHCHGTEAVVFEATLTPGLDSAKMFEGVYAAFRGHEGLGRLVQLARVFTTHGREIRFPGLFAAVLRALAVFAR